MVGDDDISLRQPVTQKRGRGRPRKPDALTNAQRQAAYRARHQPDRKSVTVTKKEHDALVRECEQLREALARLEAHFGLARRAVLERLIWWADRSVVQSLGDDDAAFNRYLNRVTENP